MTHQTAGYIRVSTQGQNVDRQLQGIELDMEFIDTASGGSLDREKLRECIDYVRRGDTLVVNSIDRLARNLRDLQQIVETITKKGVTVKFLQENLTFTGNNDDPMSTLMLQMMGAFSQFERTMIRNRQKEGMDAARKAGKLMGRPFLIDDKFREKAKEKVMTGQTISEIARDMKVSRASIYRAIKGLEYVKSY